MKKNSNQSRICSCWLNVGQCYCELETTNDAKKTEK